VTAAALLHVGASDPAAGSPDVIIVRGLAFILDATRRLDAARGDGRERVRVTAPPIRACARLARPDSAATA